MSDVDGYDPNELLRCAMNLIGGLLAGGKADAGDMILVDRIRCHLPAVPPQPAAGVPDGVDWKSMYRIQTAMRYMDNIDGLTRDKAYSMADEDVAGLKALAAPKPEVGS